ncbi:hypothetical protein M434DRAFT_285927 [Hypoxylon sp. CO27-5]|nr:hypothetical protein M434DRAFT_285927 [Hypoxylon sp. CO27-5]
MATPSTTTGHPPNVLSIHCPRSDGMAFEESRFPPQHEVVQPSADQPWLAKLGEMLGEQLYPASGLSIVEHEHVMTHANVSSGRSFVLRAFPEHYHLRVRNRDDGKLLSSYIEYYSYVK